jgi:zinc D-Ala-D-Ala carboxypeptidase
MKMNISEHITYDEAIHSDTAVQKGIVNIPGLAQITNMKYLAENVFEPLRKFIGLPIKINSFFRSRQLNAFIGGASNSQHVTGEAVDLDCNGFNKQMFHYITEHLIYDQCIWEFGSDNNPDWVHVSRTKSGNRRQSLRSYKINGQT